MIGEYNTQRSGIILKEYGRNVQKLIDHIRSVPEIEKRTALATTLIDLIKQLNPSIKDQPENPQRMWDDLYIMADFNLDINAPYPIPPEDTLSKKPMRVAYPANDVRFRHYGKNIERLVQEAVKKETPEDREESVIYLGKLMKTFYGAWNKEILDDSVILKDIKNMSNGQLTINLDKVREDNLFEKLYIERTTKQQFSSNSNSGRGDGRDGGRDRNRHKKFKRHNNHGGGGHRRRDK
jgi:Domain of unknown function (DUF4290)